MLGKKSKKGRCPFRGLKKCSNECVFYRSGVRFNEKTNENFPFEECAVNIIADNLEAMHNRIYMLQKETGEAKNANIMKILFDLGKVEKDEVLKIANKINEVKKLE